MTTGPNDQVADRDEQAALWWLDLAAGDLSADSRDAFDAWIADDENAIAFEHVARAWHAVDGAAGSPELIRMRSVAIDDYRRANRRRWAGSLSAAR